ncbi:MAG: fasciclin domain-containing protein [Bacteroidota bacterium]
MKKLFAAFFLALTTLLFATQVQAQCSSSHKSRTVRVGGTEMNSQRDIVSNFAQSNDHTTLVAAVKAADLAGTLQSDGPFTVFAPVNAAFDKLPDGTVSTLLRPENKGQLSKILTYHVVAGKLDASKIAQAIEHGGGKAELTTVSGDRLTAMMNGTKNVVLKDENGNYANVSIYDVYQSNGVVHVIDSVILPN